MSLSQNWYADNTVRRGVLVKLSVYSTGVYENIGEITKYVSNVGYTTADSSISFLPVIAGALRFSESLSVDSGISTSYGDIELINTDGSLDSWIDPAGYVWVNRSVDIYYCDPDIIVNSESDIDYSFDLIFSGVIGDIGSRSRNTLNIKVRDKMERLNAPVTENTLGTYGTWGGGTGQTNQDAVIPLVFGEPHNFQPMLIDPSVLEYQVSQGPIEQVTEIRDNGVPVYTVGILTNGATVNTATGKVRLTHPIVGECTVSAQGVAKSVNLNTGALENTYNNNIASLIALLVTEYGNASSKLTASELDLTNLLSFSTANTQYIGLVLNARENLLSVCQMLAGSIGAQIYFTRQGKLQLLRYGVYTTDTLVAIGPEDMLINSLAVSDRSTIVAAKKLGYCRNWYVQDNLVTAIPVEHKYMFNTEFWLKTSDDTTGSKVLYKLNAEPVQKDTLLVDGSQAEAEAIRLNDYFGTIRTTYKFTGYSKLLTLKLGQSVTVTHPRFGLSSGKTGQVVSLSPDWSNGRIDVEVVV